MANFNKAFTFRGGFQVDTDVLVVRGQNVGIGSTIPNERLVVDGIVQANGLKISGSESVVIEKGNAGILTVTETLYVGVETGTGLPFPEGTPQVQITTGIITAANPAIGVVTYYGDGGRLLNLPTSQWLDVDVGLGFTSIYAQGYVGVGTDDPRYVFQVGGVPYTPKAGFNTSQEGVGIESGSIWASDNISIGGTITADGEFIGIGSLVTDLNASALKYGVIGSTLYGDINCGILSASEIRSPIFIGNTIIGTATTAIGVQTTSQLDFATGIADELIARDRFLSVDGFLQIGADDIVNEQGQIEAIQSGTDSTIYSLSDATARVIVGRQRELGNRREFGGVRFGGNVSADPLSGLNDLDIINYDVGNVNYYLHGGSGGSLITEGEFQWIYGQRNSVVASLSKDGKFNLPGNFDQDEVTLNVTGLSSFFGDVYFDTDVYVGAALSVFGGITIGGDVTLEGELLTGGFLQLENAAVSGILTVGPGVGVGLTFFPDGRMFTNGVITVNNNLNQPSVLISPSGNINVTDSLTADLDVNASRSMFAPTIEASQTLEAPGFIADGTSTRITNLDVNNIGNDSSAVNLNDDLVAGTTIISPENNSIIIDNLTVNTSVTLPTSFSPSFDVVTVNTVNAGTVNATTVDTNQVTTSGLDATNIAATGTVSAQTVNAANANLTGTIIAAAGQISTVDVVDLNVSNSAILPQMQNIGVSSLTADTAEIQNLIVSGNTDIGNVIIGVGDFNTLNADTGNINSLNVVTINPLSPATTVEVSSQLDVLSDLDVSGGVSCGLVTTSDVNTSTLTVTGQRILLGSDSSTQIELDVSVDTNLGELIFDVSVGGSSAGTARITLT